MFRADFGFYSEVGARAEDPIYRGNPYNISIGLLGQVTTAISAIARVGFGDTLAYAAGQDFFGTTNDYLVARDWTLASGRAFEDTEMSGAGKVAPAIACSASAIAAMRSKWPAAAPTLNACCGF